MPELYNLLPPASTLYHYAAYGITIRSDAPLPLPPPTALGLLELEIHSKNGPIDSSIREQIRFEQDPSTAFDIGSLCDGWNYVGWRGIGEILVSPNGRYLACYRDDQSSFDSFNVYLLTQALSFALVKSGLEPLHATAAAIDGKAAVFLGDCGFGKSTLAAAFLQAGYRLLTDDLLVLHKTHAAPLAYPGSPRIKLFPDLARKFLGDAVTGVPMNPHTHKLILPLKHSQVCTHVLPVGAIYALAPPSDVRDNDVHIAPMNRRQAFLTILASAFNRAILDSTRLRRQFEMAQALANAWPVKKLSYPRTFDYLPAVLDAVVLDLCAKRHEVACGV
jgi:hypothetical protein